MLGWSINLFRIFGIQLAIHVSFLLLLAYAAVVGWQDGGGLIEAGLSVGLMVVLFVCVVLHELGHSLVAMRYGVRVPRILLLPIGGMAEFDRIPRQPSQELLITLAGPAVNFALALGLVFAFGVPPGWPWHAGYPDTFPGFGQLLMNWNLGMGVFNLLPVFPMDGGRILRALLATRMDYLRATWWASVGSKVLAPVLAYVAFFQLHWSMLGVLFIFIFFVGDAEYKQILLREEEARYSAEIARRLNELKSSAASPPASTLIIHGPN
jgi:Zn-dependent protease